MTNIKTTTSADCVKAKPKATPRNGALQGVGRAVASTPLKNAPALPSFDARPAAAPIARPLTTTSKPPRKAYNSINGSERRGGWYAPVSNAAPGGPSTRFISADTIPEELDSGPMDALISVATETEPALPTTMP